MFDVDKFVSAPLSYIQSKQVTMSLTVTRISDGLLNIRVQTVVILHRHHVALIRVTRDSLDLKCGFLVADDNDGQYDASDTCLDRLRQRSVLVHRRLSVRDEYCVVRDIFSISVGGLSTV